MTAPEPRLRCAVLDDYQGVALSLADWGSLADRIEVRAFTRHIEREDELVEAIGEHEIVVIMRERTALHAGLLARLPRLRLLVTSGLQNAAIDVAAARDRGIVVCGTPSSSDPPAELTWALVLGLCRHLVPEAIGEAELRRMRRTALLVNTSRAEIVDQAALARALREGWIAAAAADVFESEPLPLAHPLRSLPNFLGTPHLGYVTERNYRGYFEGAVEDIAAWLAGAPIRELT